MIFIIILVLAWAATSVVSFGLMWYDWHKDFGPHNHKGHPGARWPNLPFNEEQFRGDRRTAFMMSLLGPFTVGVIFSLLLENGFRFRFKL